MSWHKLAVGQQYIPGRDSWPERPDLSVGPHGVELRLFLRGPTDREVAAVRAGTAQFAWISGEHGALLCYRFSDGVPWGDVSYHATTEPKDRAGLPSASGLMCTVLLVDAATGILRAIRLVSWPDRAAAAVRTTVEQQIAQGRNPSAELAWINALYQRFPGNNGTAKLVRERADLTWTAGRHPQAAAGTGPDAAPPAHTPDVPAGNPALLAALGNLIVSGKVYPQPLPAELAGWYCYLADAGHSIAIVPQDLFDGESELGDRLCPAPVRTVLRVGWRVHNGFVVAAIPYDRTLGLRAPEEDSEY